jgi:hypothetical protein
MLKYILAARIAGRVAGKYRPVEYACRIRSQSIIL